MKKKMLPRLTLKRETLRQLNESMARRVAGGFSEFGLCTENCGPTAGSLRCIPPTYVHSDPNCY